MNAVFLCIPIVSCCCIAACVPSMSSAEKKAKPTLSLPGSSINGGTALEVPECEAWAPRDLFNDSSSLGPASGRNESAIAGAFFFSHSSISDKSR